MSSVKEYKYYDTPEGQDIHKKLWLVGKYAGAAGLGLSIVDIMCHSHPKGYLPTIGRCLYITGPIIGIASTFVLVSNLAVSLRNGKNDKLNYVVGGLAAGGVMGAWRRNVVTGALCGIGFAILASVKKLSIEEGWELFPMGQERMHGNHRSARHDFTLIADRPQYKNWTTGAEK